MSADISLDSLRSLIADVVDIDEAKVTDAARFIEDLGMESLMALEVMVALEKRYRVKFTEADLPRIKNLKDVQGLLAERLPGAVSVAG